MEWRVLPSTIRRTDECKGLKTQTHITPLNGLGGGIAAVCTHHPLSFKFTLITFNVRGEEKVPLPFFLASFYILTFSLSFEWMTLFFFFLSFFSLFDDWVLCCGKGREVGLGFVIFWPGKHCWVVGFCGFGRWWGLCCDWFGFVILIWWGSGEIFCGVSWYGFLVLEVGFGDGELVRGWTFGG